MNYDMMNMKVLKLSEEVTLQDTPMFEADYNVAVVKYLMYQNAVVTGLFL